MDHYPIVPGHEIAGLVHALGEKAQAESELTVGDRVVVYPWIGCGRCPHCLVGEHHLCPDSKEIGFCADGGYSEFVRVHHHQFVLKLPDKIPFVLGALLSCGGITAYSALKKCSQAAVRASRWQEGNVFAMVIGLGGVGRWALKLLPLTLRGFKTHVMGVDVNHSKAQEAKGEGGLDDTFLLNGEETAHQQAQEYLKQSNYKPNVILDFVNSTHTFSFGTEVLARAGVRVMVGLHGGVGELQLPLAVVSESAHVGSIVGSLEDLREVLELVVQHEVGPPSVEIYRLHDASRALRRLEKGEVNGRAVLVMSDDHSAGHGKDNQKKSV